jgi:hypothetical protein
VFLKAALEAGDVDLVGGRLDDRAAAHMTSLV